MTPRYQQIWLLYDDQNFTLFTDWKKLYVHYRRQYIYITDSVINEYSDDCNHINFPLNKRFVELFFVKAVLPICQKQNYVSFRTKLSATTTQHVVCWWGPVLISHFRASDSYHDGNLNSFFVRRSPNTIYIYMRMIQQW